MPRAIKKYQDSGEITEKQKQDIEKFRPPVEWFSKYLDSPYYNTLISGEERDTSETRKYYVDKYDKKLLDFVGATEMQKKYGANYPYQRKLDSYGNVRTDPKLSISTKPGGSYYDERKHAINISPEIDEWGEPTGEGGNLAIMAHELGHTDEGWMSQPFADWVSMHVKPDKDIKDTATDIQKMRVVQNPAFLHEMSEKETRSDLIRLRYKLEEDDIFKSTGGFKKFTSEDYDKAVEKYGKTKHETGRIFRKYDKDEVIFLMNHMAAINKEDIYDVEGKESEVKTARRGMRIIKKNA